MSSVFLITAVIMAKQPLGKTLLRNVIRHTDAHNKVRLIYVFVWGSGKRTQPVYLEHKAKTNSYFNFHTFIICCGDLAFTYNLPPMMYWPLCTYYILNIAELSFTYNNWPHSQIQEEMEMWKMRDLEIQTSQSDSEFVRWEQWLHLKHSMTKLSFSWFYSQWLYFRGRMHCNRVSDLPRDWSRSRDQVSEHDDREARYWTRKLYDFEAKDPDRYSTWHSIVTFCLSICFYTPAVIYR